MVQMPAIRLGNIPVNNLEWSRENTLLCLSMDQMYIGWAAISRTTCITSLQHEFGNNNTSGSFFEVAV